jgi:teichuronic acid biosynthesis glycosyltransferase TuaG
MKMRPLLSIIMPAYNAGEYIEEAIESVLYQSFYNWELLIVDDGSTDNTASIISSFDDPRIQCFQQENKGVASARNLALREMKGEYFCFLDADDVLPPNSLKSRIEVFELNPHLSFVDGLVVYKDRALDKTLKVYQPDFNGHPYKELIKINPRCYFGLSWMIKRNLGIEYLFEENMTHAEDLFFYISISDGKLYDYTSEEVLYYRISGRSAMANLEGLENGYYKLYKNLKASASVTVWDLAYLKFKIIKIMMLSHLFDGKSLERSIKVFFRYLVA